MTQPHLSQGCPEMLTFFRKTISAEWTQTSLEKWRESLHFPLETEYFQLVLDWGSKKHQAGNSHPFPSTLGTNLPLRYERTWEKKIIQDCKEQKSPPTLLLALELSR